MPILPPDAEQAPDEDHPMWEYINDGYNFDVPERGEIREGTILSVESDHVIVDVGAKRDAVVPERDLQLMSDKDRERLKPGARIQTLVLNPMGQDEELVVSINLALQQEDWDEAEGLLDNGDIVECEVTGYNRGGLLVDFGRIQGFVPASHVAGFYSHGGDRQARLAEFIGEVLPLKVIEVDRDRRRLVMSNQKAQKEWEEEQRADLIDELQVGDVRHGAVVGLADFGAFIEIDGATGLAHISELSWRQIRHPREVLDVGDEVDVYVLDLDPERNRISLSMKHLQPNPWEGIEERYYIGDSIQGEVVNVVDFGAFVQVEPGVEGLIHTSEMGQHAGDPREILSIGDTIMARIIHLDPDDHRMGLHLLDIERPEREEDAETDSDAEAEPMAVEGAEVDEVEAVATADDKVESEADTADDTEATEPAAGEAVEAEERATTETGLGAEEPQEPGHEEPTTTTPPVEGGEEVEDELHTSGHEAIDREEPMEAEGETAAEMVTEGEGEEEPIEVPVG